MIEEKYGLESLEFRMNHPSTGAQRACIVHPKISDAESKLIVNFSLNRNYKSVHSVRRCLRNDIARTPTEWGQCAIVHVLSTHYMETINYIDKSL